MNPAICELLNRASQALIQGQPAEAERALQQALEVDPGNIEALRAAARFYFSAMRNMERARHYAALCRAQTDNINREMSEILGETMPRKLPASRHIGGIIGPY